MGLSITSVSLTSTGTCPPLLRTFSIVDNIFSTSLLVGRFAAASLTVVNCNKTQRKYFRFASVDLVHFTILTRHKTYITGNLSCYAKQWYSECVQLIKCVLLIKHYTGVYTVYIACLSEYWFVVVLCVGVVDNNRSFCASLLGDIGARVVPMNVASFMAQQQLNSLVRVVRYITVL